MSGNSQQNMDKVADIKTGIYRHYKGKTYDVIGAGTNTEAREVFVIYKHLYDTPGYSKDALWIRPYDMFFEQVTVDGKAVPRFEYIGDKE